MIEVRPFSTLGGADHGWLKAKHHFSFANYNDMSRMGWGALRVWNDDTISPFTGFDPHGHRDMEIVTYVRKGAITHTDRLGNVGRTEAGDVQVMSAGKGIVHSEYNQEPDDTQIFQIWIMPNKRHAEPYWEARNFPKDRNGKLTVLASGRDGDTDALPINQDAAVLGGSFKAGDSTTYDLGKGRYLYLVSTDGKIEVNGTRAESRDGVAIRDLDSVEITALEDTQIVLVDAPDLDAVAA